MIEHILLDMGNVLLSFDPERAVKDVLGNHPRLPQIIDATTLSPQWKALDQGTLSEEQAICAMVSNAPALSEEIRTFMEHWDEHLQPVLGMERLVEELKKCGYSLHLLSNAGIRFRRYSPRFPVFSLLDTIHISADMKLVKPDIRIYQQLIRELKLSAGECLFIDDLDENIRGAQAVGIHSLRFTSCNRLRRSLTDLRLLSGRNAR